VRIGNEVQVNPLTVYYPIPNEALPFDFTSDAFAVLAYHPRAHRSQGRGRLLHSCDWANSGARYPGSKDDIF